MIAIVSIIINEQELFRVLVALRGACIANNMYGRLVPFASFALFISVVAPRHFALLNLLIHSFEPCATRSILCGNRSTISLQSVNSSGMT